MAGTRKFDDTDAVTELLPESPPMLGWGDAVAKPLHDENGRLDWRAPPVVVRCRSVCRGLGGGDGGPSRHAAQEGFRGGGIGNETSHRLEALRLGGVVAEPRPQRLHHLSVGCDEPDTRQQDKAAHHIGTICQETAGHPVAEAVAQYVRGPTIESFDHRRHIGGESMQREPVQRSGTSASPTGIHRDGTETGAREALGEITEIAAVEATPWKEHHRVASSDDEELDDAPDDLNRARQRVGWMLEFVHLQSAMVLWFTCQGRSLPSFGS